MTNDPQLQRWYPEIRDALNRHALAICELSRTTPREYEGRAENERVTRDAVLFWVYHYFRPTPEEVAELKRLDDARRTENKKDSRCKTI